MNNEDITRGSTLLEQIIKTPEDKVTPETTSSKPKPKKPLSARSKKTSKRVSVRSKNLKRLVKAKSAESNVAAFDIPAENLFRGLDAIDWGVSNEDRVATLTRYVPKSVLKNHKPSVIQFVANYLAFGCKSREAMMAYGTNSTNMATLDSWASRMKKEGLELMFYVRVGIMAEQKDMHRELLTGEIIGNFRAIFREAMSMGQYKYAISATENLGKIHGVYVTQNQNINLNLGQDDLKDNLSFNMAKTSDTAEMSQSQQIRNNSIELLARVAEGDTEVRKMLMDRLETEGKKESFVLLEQPSITVKS